jgi:hypothetical protein
MLITCFICAIHLFSHQWRQSECAVEEDNRGMMRADAIPAQRHSVPPRRMQHNRCGTSCPKNLVHCHPVRHFGLLWDDSGKIALYAQRAIPFAVIVGFLAGLPLNAVFGKLLGLDVVRASGIANMPERTQ